MCLCVKRVQLFTIVVHMRNGDSFLYDIATERRQKENDKMDILVCNIVLDKEKRFFTSLTVVPVSMIF